MSELLKLFFTLFCLCLQKANAAGVNRRKLRLEPGAIESGGAVMVGDFQGLAALTEKGVR